MCGVCRVNKKAFEFYFVEQLNTFKCRVSRLSDTGYSAKESVREMKICKQQRGLSLDCTAPPSGD